MAGFNPDYLPIRVIRPDFGAIDSWGGGTTPPSSWQKFADWPGESGDVKANDFTPFTPVFTCTTTGAGNTPRAYYQDAFITNGNIPHRISGAVRAGQDDFTSPPPPSGVEKLTCLLAVVYSTRFASDPGGDPPILYIGMVSVQDEAGKFLFQAIETNGQSQLIKWPVQNTLFANSYYTVGAEVLGQTVNLYLDPAGASDPSDLAGASALEYFGTVKLTNTRGFEGPIVHVGFSVGGKLSGAGNLGTAVYNLVLEELEGPPGIGSGVEGGAGSPNPFVPDDIAGPQIAIPPGGAEPYVPFNPYHPYKSFRAVTDMLNYVRLDP